MNSQEKRSAIQKGEKQEFISPLEFIDKKIALAMKSEFEADKGWADVGVLLEQVRKEDLWKERHESFNDYLISLEERHKKHRSQLHHYRAVAGLLEEYTTPKQLNAMGIAKASVLAKAVKQGTVPPADVIEAAQKTTNRVEDVRKLLFDSSPLNGQNDEKGVWTNFGSAYLTPDEKLVYESARTAAWHTDPVTKEDLPEHVRQKEFLIKICENFLADHSENIPDAGT